MSAAFFDNPVFGTHSPLVLGWSDDQLRPVMDVVVPLLPDCLTERGKLAVASVARSLVIEKKITGSALHFARGKVPYSRPRRYRDHDGLATWHFVTTSMDHLEAAGLIEQALGFWSRNGRGRQSVAWATDDLVSLVVPWIDVHEPRVAPFMAETVVLRDRADKRHIDYPETADTAALREQVQIVNDALAQLDLFLYGTRRDIPVGRRIFNGSFERGGRLYFKGWSVQNVPADERLQLQLLIDGRYHPMIEIDYSALHITMAYTEAGQPIPEGDPFILDGFSRNLVKTGTNTLLNSTTRNKGVLGITKELLEDPLLQDENNIHARSRPPYRAVASKLVAALEEKHRPIEEYFGSDCGARFQRTDSDMAVQVMTRMIQRTGRCPIPVHDSFLVAAIDADLLSQTMTEVAEEFGLHLLLKDSRDHPPEVTSNPPYLPPPSSSPFVGNSPDLHE